ncbi:MAG TPA: ABC-2 family transporter protein [Candidatus Limnocylindrales bacterium]
MDSGPAPHVRDPDRERVHHSRRNQPRFGGQRLLDPHSLEQVPVFVHQLGDFAKYPITIYLLGVQALIVVAVPFAFISFFPTAFVFGVEAWSIAGLLTPLVAVYSLVMAVTIFRIGLRHYESTGH